MLIAASQLSRRQRYNVLGYKNRKTHYLIRRSDEIADVEAAMPVIS